MSSFPLLSFLLALESDGICLTARDYERIARVLGSDAEWTLARLRDVLLTLLAKDEEQRDLFLKRFQGFFDTDLADAATRKADFRKLRAELQNFQPRRGVSAPARHSPRPKKKAPRRRLLWLSLLIATSLNIGLLLYFLWPDPPRAELNPGAAFFSEGKIKKFTLRNAGGGQLQVQEITFSGDEAAKAFSISDNGCDGQILDKGQTCRIQIIFRSALRLKQELNIRTDAGNVSASLSGSEKTSRPRPPPNQDLYALPPYPVSARVPIIQEIKKTPIQGGDAWQNPALLAAVFLLLALGYGAYLWKAKQTPRDKAPEWRKDLPRHFPMEKIGGAPGPRLDGETLAHLADCMGYFRSEQTGKRPDIDASVLATVAHGGIASLVFHRRKQLRHLIILVDGLAAEACRFNPVAEELREGMTRLGVSLLYGHFFGDPAIFHTVDGRTFYLEDLETERNAWLLLIFADGLHMPQNFCHTLESLARWPQAAWLELRAPEFRKISAAAAEYGIPVYPATAAGLLAVFARFLSETAPQTGADEAADSPQPGDGATDHYEVEFLLGDALAWAQACAMIQPVTLGLADALRRKFYCHLPPERIERLAALPNTLRNAAGLRFSSAFLAALRSGFALRQEEKQQEEVLAFILTELRRVWEAELKNDPELRESPAQLAWEKRYEQVRLELDPEPALKRLAELKKTPLGNSVLAEMELTALPGAEQGGVPLRKAPKSRDARLRLAGLSKTSGLVAVKKYPLKWPQKALAGFLGLCFLGAAVWSAWEWRNIIGERQQARIAVWSNEDLRAGIALQVRSNESWQTLRHSRPPKPLSPASENPEIPPDRPSRESGNPEIPSDRHSRPPNRHSRERGNPGLSTAGAGLPAELKVFPDAEYRLALYGSADTPLHTLNLGRVDQNFQVQITTNKRPDPSAKTAFLAVTDKHRQVLHGGRVTVLNALFSQTVRTDRTLVLTAGEWQVKAELAHGAGSAWRTVSLAEGEKSIQEFAFDAYFRDTLKDGGFGPQMVTIPAGSFKMGDIQGGGEDDEKPVHEVTLDAFSIGRHEVTVREFRRFADAAGYKTEAEKEGGCASVKDGVWDYYEGLDWRNPGFKQADGHPVVCVSWNDAAAYIRWLNEQTGEEYRLPTEAEWEYMARAGTETAYWQGEEISHEHANYGKDECCGGFVQGKDRWEYTAPPGSFAPNPFGVHDIAGNVWEWGRDWYAEDYYAKSPKENPAGPETGSNRVIRGGGWNSSPRNVRSASRVRNDLGNRISLLGFRLARTNPLPSYTKSKPSPEPEFFSDLLKDGSKAPEMAPIHGGTFKMGDIQGGGRDEEKPVHELILGDFSIGRYEVTFEEYDKFCEAVGREKPKDSGWGRGKRPVIHVSWEDAQAYAKWLTGQTGYVYRLPTEAEWEFAARAGTETAYWWGKEASHEYANYGKDECCGVLALGRDKWENAAPVGSFKENAFGLYDTVGNVWEWVQDWYDAEYYAKSPKENPAGPEAGSFRVFRGGGWYDSPRLVRSAFRFRNAPDYRGAYLGFRLARIGPWPPSPFTLEEPVLVSIPAGTFRMGDIQGGGLNREKPVHDVTLNAFSIGKYEVTVREFRQFVDAAGYKSEAEKEGSCYSYKDDIWNEVKDLDWRNPGFEQTDEHPVACVSWNDATAYIEWLNSAADKKYRLPAEAEWEYVARAGTETVYWWGNEASHAHANYGKDECCGPFVEGKDQWEYTAPTGSFGANPFEVHDMAGNVWEWVQDRYGDYSEEAQRNPSGSETGSIRVIRGGSWFVSPRYVRSANRGRLDPGVRNANLGFRLASDPLPPYPFTLDQGVEPKLVPYEPFTDSLRDGGEAPEMVFLPGGTFKMGDIQGSGDDDEKPVHEITLGEFAIGRYEVTVGEFRIFVEAAKYETEAEKKDGCFSYSDLDYKKHLNWRNPGFEQTEMHPVACVSRNDAMAYTQWLSEQTGENYGLPTEAEWEYAVRAGTDTAYHFGNDEKQLGEYAWYSANSDKKTHPGGEKKANAWKLYDMHGNVWEWVQDWYAEDYYVKSPKENPAGPETGSYRVLRGGSWSDSPRFVRSADRFRGDPGSRFAYLGFRLARR
ncbi:MAG: SUMF1/EgtB/PvdO family nonheme iron enzyme [Gammaproteobacteria bacterium]|nr:SUMF1/EgtB/PvdO family nonheme iron enzyme [Gammaproteobacteria bacterium]